VTLQEPRNLPIADVDPPDTEEIVVAHPSPVFVDSTGRRRRMLRKVAYGFGALCMVYGGLISVSLAGGPVSSSAVLPLPDLADGGDEEEVVVARPSPTPEPVTARTTQPILEAFPTRGAPVTRPHEARAVTPRTTAAVGRPTGTPKPSTTKKPSASPSAPKPVESTTTKPEPSQSPTTTDPTTPADPAPGGQGGGSTGGQGGNSQSDSGGGQSSGGTGGQGGGSTGGQGGGSSTGGGSDDGPAAEAPANDPVPPKPPAPAKDEPAGGSQAEPRSGGDPAPPAEPEPDDGEAP
jgi:hypothetical protein